LTLHLSNAKTSYSASEKLKEKKVRDFNDLNKIMCKNFPKPIDPNETNLMIVNGYVLNTYKTYVFDSKTKTCVPDNVHVRFTGYGTVTEGILLSKITYTGGFQNGLYSGEGKLTNDIISHVGTFINGKLTGNGEKYIRGKLNYRGEFLNNKYHGQGTYFYPNGNMYIGFFENDLRHGHGKMIYLDGTVIEGEWRYSFYISGNYQEFLVY
jgi:hypothetical protein